MDKKVGVLLVHGIGGVTDDFAHDTIQELREKVSGRGLRSEEIAWQSVHWAPLLSERENQVWVDLSAEHDLNWAKMRRFFLDLLGTGCAYHATRECSSEFYRQLHGIVHQALRELREQLGGDKPLVVIAHSWGSVLISNYIWDRQKGKEEGSYGATSFERMETLAGLVTMGSTIPLVTVSCPRVVSIQFPPQALPERLKRRAKWLNFYDADDVLGWPLKPLDPSYAAAVHEDLEVSVGNILNSWNPASHGGYWSDEAVLKPVAYLIGSILESCQGGGPGLPP